MDTVQGNKLIAIFDDGIQIAPYHEWKFKDERGSGYKTYRDEELQYHSSWEWLMPIVEKISNIHYPDYFTNCPESHEREPYEDCAYPRTFGMRDKEGNYMFRFNANVLHSAKTLINAVWLACVEFIKDYNEQNFIEQ